VALAERHVVVARRLAREPTDAGVRTTDGLTLLMAAARAEDLDLARWAIEHGADVNALRPNKRHATALIIASRLGNVEIVELLLANGAETSLTNRDGETALDLARGASIKSRLRDAATAQSDPPSTPPQSP
jgi:ankyrin repeat protein